MHTLDHTFTIRSWEVDSRRRARLDVLFAFLLETAWLHAEQLGFGYSHLADQGKLWVLARFSLQLSVIPQWGRTVTVRTWPRAARSVFAMREFQLMDAAGVVTGRATSAWLILDAASRRPLRSAKILTTVTELRSDLATGGDAPELPAFAPTADPTEVTARYSDIDVNCHVTSSRYLTWILDCYPAEFHASHDPVSLEINFLGEVRAGENLSISNSENAGSIYTHAISRAQTGQDVCRARLGWGRSFSAYRA